MCIPLASVCLTGGLIACTDVGRDKDKSLGPIIAADEIEEIRMSMYYQDNAVSGAGVYPQDNAQGIKETMLH